MRSRPRVTPASLAAPLPPSRHIGGHARLCGTTDPLRSCMTCAHYGHLVADSAVWCEMSTPGYVRSQPHHGCAYWLREPGADAQCEV